jgi:rhodanese-related sulfurtransferase
MENYRKEYAQMLEDNREKLIIDLRKDREFNLGSCPGAIHIYWEEFDNQLDELPKNKPIYLMCYTGVTSDEYAEILNERGFEVYSIVDGYRGYLRWSFSQE